MDDQNLLRVFKIGALPLGLRDVLWDGASEPSLDRVATPLYGSAMNQMVRDQRDPSRDPAPAQPGATLFAFLETADRLYGQLAQALSRVGLSYAKYEVLRHLREAGAPVSLGALAEGQQCARSNITQLIDRLETERLVRRVEDPTDRRGVRAELTPEGLALAEEGATQIDVVRAQFAASFSAAERAELSRLLGRIP